MVQAESFSSCLKMVRPSLASDVLLLETFTKPYEMRIHDGQITMVEAPNHFWRRTLHSTPLGAHVKALAVKAANQLKIDDDMLAELQAIGTKIYKSYPLVDLGILVRAFKAAREKSEHDLGAELKFWRDVVDSARRMDESSSSHFKEEHDDTYSNVRDCLMIMNRAINIIESEDFLLAVKDLLAKCPFPPPEVSVAAPISHTDAVMEEWRRKKAAWNTTVRPKDLLFGDDVDKYGPRQEQRSSFFERLINMVGPQWERAGGLDVRCQHFHAFASFLWLECKEFKTTVTGDAEGTELYLAVKESVVGIASHASTVITDELVAACAEGS